MRKSLSDVKMYFWEFLGLVSIEEIISNFELIKIATSIEHQLKAQAIS